MRQPTPKMLGHGVYFVSYACHAKSSPLERRRLPARHHTHSYHSVLEFDYLPSLGGVVTSGLGIEAARTAMTQVVPSGPEVPSLTPTTDPKIKRPCPFLP